MSHVFFSLTNSIEYGIIPRVDTREKLLNKIAQNPKSVRFADLDKLLRVSGFSVRQPRSGSSHYIYGRGTIRISVPYHRPHVKEHYVREVLKLIGATDEEKS